MGKISHSSLVNICQRLVNFKYTNAPIGIVITFNKILFDLVITKPDDRITTANLTMIAITKPALIKALIKPLSSDKKLRLKPYIVMIPNKITHSLSTVAKAAPAIPNFGTRIIFKATLAIKDIPNNTSLCRFFSSSPLVTAINKLIKETIIIENI